MFHTLKSKKKITFACRYIIYLKLNTLPLMQLSAK